MTDISPYSNKITNTTSSRRVVKNAIFNSAGWTVNVLLALIATPILVKKLSLEGYGIYSLLTGLASYYGLLDLGLGQGVIKFISEAKAKNDSAQINNSINTALCLQIVLGIIGSLLLILLAVPLLHLLKVSPQFFRDAQTGLFACTFGFFFTMLSSTFSSSLMGLQRYDITSKVTAAANVRRSRFRFPCRHETASAEVDAKEWTGMAFQTAFRTEEVGEKIFDHQYVLYLFDD